MNIEIICWIVAFVLVWEGIFIYLRYRDKNKRSSYEQINWIWDKIMAFLYVIVFMMIQMCIVGNHKASELLGRYPFHYEGLIYEAGIIIAIWIFFELNKIIAGVIEKK